MGKNIILEKACINLQKENNKNSLSFCGGVEKTRTNLNPKNVDQYGRAALLYLVMIRPQLRERRVPLRLRRVQRLLFLCERGANGRLFLLLQSQHGGLLVLLRADQRGVLVGSDEETIERVSVP